MFYGINTNSASHFLSFPPLAGRRGHRRRRGGAIAVHGKRPMWL
jgi:hypothetical protein